MRLHVTAWLGTFIAITLFAVAPGFAACNLVWDEPSGFTDGSPIAPGDIKSYRVYVANKPDAFPIGSPAVEILALSNTVNPVTHIPCADANVQPGKKVAVTAVNQFGTESDVSNVLTNVKPGKPEKHRVEDL